MAGSSITRTITAPTGGSTRPSCGRPRDLYVYLPPGYDPSIAYPLILFLHGADVDEHDFLDPGDLKALDGMMSRGEIPPVIIAAPDGTYERLEYLGSRPIRSGSTAWAGGSRTTSSARSCRS